MLQNIIEALRGLADIFAQYPIPFTIGTIIVVTLIYYKWVWIGRAQSNALKNAYTGWKVDGAVDSAQRLVLRPVKMRAVGVWTFLFFGGGALFYGMVVLPGAQMTPMDWFAFVAMCAFAMLAVVVFLISFTKVTFDGDVFTRTGVFGPNIAVRADALSDVRPISKTIAGGIFLNFGDQGQIRVGANMSGYRQLLEILAQHNPHLRLLVGAYSAAAKKHL